MYSRFRAKGSEKKNKKSLGGHNSHKQKGFIAPQLKIKCSADNKNPMAYTTILLKSKESDWIINWKK
jgi:hypothetical protein